MAVDKIAALVWRFIGLYFVVGAVPMLLTMSGLFVGTAAVLMLGVGVALLGFSRPLGRMIARGL